MTVGFFPTRRLHCRVCLALDYLIGLGDNWAVTKLSFAHVTTKTWAYSKGVWLFQTKILAKKTVPFPLKSFFENIFGNKFLIFLKYESKALQRFVRIVNI